MKKINIFITTGLIALSSVVGLTSCSDFLESQPTGSMPEDSVFAGVQNVKTLIPGIYDSYRWNCVRDRWAFLGPQFGTDEIQTSARVYSEDASVAGLNLYNGQLSATNQYVATIWNDRWPTLVGAAKALYAANMAKDDVELAHQLAGEAAFFRGMVMYELTCYWGSIPVIDMEKQDSLGLGRQPLTTVWQYIISDFNTAATYLPETADASTGAGPEATGSQITSGAALAMLGRAYMSAPTETGLRDFAKADECFKKIIASGKYQLMANYADIFSVENNNSSTSISESLYTVFFNNTNAPNSIQNDTGSTPVITWFGGGCYFAGWDYFIPTPFCRETVDQGGLWEEGDLRRNASIRYDYTYNTNWFVPDGTGNGAVRQDPVGSQGYFAITPNVVNVAGVGKDDYMHGNIKKFEDSRTDYGSGLGINDAWHCGKNIPKIRYADVLLLHAECLNELGQTSDAVEVVNTVRTRAWGGTLPASAAWSTGMSQADFRKNIMDERMRELAFEGWRRIDLIRTGNLVPLAKARNSWTAQSNTIQDFNILYPIPDSEIKTNPAFSPKDQNPGYN